MIRTVGRINDRSVREATLVSTTGVAIDVMDWGAVVRDWRVPVEGGTRRVVLGLANPADYPAHSPHLGAIAGRVANRIGGGAFTLDGRAHRLPTDAEGLHLHGGPAAFGQRFWEMEQDGDGVRLVLDSPDGDGGYPGRLRATVRYGLVDNRLVIDFDAAADAPTPVNLVQHHYFNLMGRGDILDHWLTVRAGAYTETDASLVPTGRVLPVDGTPLDFRQGRDFRSADGQPCAVDDNLVLDADRGDEPAATLVAPDESLSLRLWTDRPGLQVYNGGTLSVTAPGHDGADFGPFAGLCLEDQAFPDAVNHTAFPSTILRPRERYRRRTIIEIS